MNKVRVYHGNIVFSATEESLTEQNDGYIVVKDGIVDGIYPVLPDEYKDIVVTDFGDDVIIPAFSDLHTHAPQYPNRGLKTDAILYDWLNEYTFPLEAKYADTDFAKEVYKSFVDDMVNNGTMHAVVFGTIHSKSTGILIDLLESKGINSFVGKVNMDVDSPDYLIENTADSVRDAEIFLDKYVHNEYSKPILTPRFAPTCSPDLLKGLGKLASKYNVGVQTHLVESKWEAKEAIKRYPDCSCDTEIYENAGLLGHGPMVGAHFIFPSEEDIRIIKKYGGFAVQCPDATVNVIAGIMPTKKLMDDGVNLALGSDVSAGQSLAIFRQVAQSVQLSKIRSFYEGSEVVTFAQAFFMATKGGGRLFGKYGSFEKGCVFDALVITGQRDRFMPISSIEVVERFCASGTVNNIRARIRKGELI